MSRVSFVVLLVGLLTVLETSCSSGRSPVVHTGSVKDAHATINGLKIGQLLSDNGVRIPRASRSLRPVEVIAAGSVILTILFLLLRCVSSIHGTALFGDVSLRRLAGAGGCEEVSALQLLRSVSGESNLALKLVMMVETKFFGGLYRTAVQEYARISGVTMLDCSK